MSAILAAILDFSKILCFVKLQQILLELVIKHMFLASNTKIIENTVKKKNLQQIFPKSYNFLFWTLICIINYK